MTAPISEKDVTDVDSLFSFFLLDEVTNSELPQFAQCEAVYSLM